MILNNKIDFAVIFRVNNANPNGDPLNGNRPRVNYDGLGEISDVCIKRKMRDRLMESPLKRAIFVQSDDNKADNHVNLRSRADAVLDSLKTPNEIKERACKEWFDVRAFGQVFAFKSSGNKKNKAEGEKTSDEGVSIGIRGPVSVHPAFSDKRVEVTSTQITKCTSNEGDGIKRASDQMGMKHRVDRGIYAFYGSINPQLAQRTGFSDEDSKDIKSILPRLFENDASSARPEGSMEILKVIWWQHNCPNGQTSSAKVHRSLKWQPKEDGTIDVSFDNIPGLNPEVIEGY